MARRLAEDRFSTRLQWLFILVLFLGAVGLGITGFMQAHPPAAQPWSGLWGREILDNIYRTLILFTMNTTAEATNDNGFLLAARIMAPAATLSALAKILIQAAYSRAVLGTLKGHVVVVGLNRAGLAIARVMREHGARVAAIDKAPDEETQALARSMGITLVIGDGSQWPVMQDAAVGRARHLFATMGDDIRNIETAVQAARLHEQSDSGRLSLHIELAETDISRELQDYEVYLERLTRSETGIHFFNTDAVQARRLLLEHPFPAYADMMGQARIHLAFIGLSGQAEAIAVETVLNSPFRDLGRPQLTYIVADPAQAKAALLDNQPGLHEAADLHFLEAGDGERALREAITKAAETVPLTATILAADEENRAVPKALSLYSAARMHTITPGLVFINTDATGGFLSLVADAGVKLTSATLVPFGLSMDEGSFHALVGDSDTLARDLHVAYEAKHSNEEGVARLASTGDAGWERLPETYRRSNRRSADHLPIKLLSAGYRVPVRTRDIRLAEHDDFMSDGSEQEAMSRLEHDRWSIDRILDGWSYGEPRDNLAKKHPMLRPYDALSRPEQLKDTEQVEFVADVLRNRERAKATAKREAVIGLAAIGEADFDSVRPALDEVFRQRPGAVACLLSPGREGTEADLLRKAYDYLEAQKRSPRLLLVTATPAMREAALPDAKAGDDNAQWAWKTADWMIDLAREEKEDLLIASMAYLAERSDFLIAPGKGGEDDPGIQRLLRFRHAPGDIPDKHSSLAPAQRKTRSFSRLVWLADARAFGDA